MPKLDNQKYPILQNFVDCAPCAAALVRVHLEDQPNDGFIPITLIYDAKKGQYVVQTHHLPKDVVNRAKEKLDHFLAVQKAGHAFLGLAEVVLWKPVPPLKRDRKKK